MKMRMFWLVLCGVVVACTNGYDATHQPLAKAELSSVQQVAGIVRIGHEVRSFQDNRDCKEYWLVDKSGNLEKEYQTVIGNETQRYQPVFARLKVKNIGKMSEGVGAEYDGAYEVIEIEEMSKNLADRHSPCGNALR